MMWALLIVGLINALFGVAVFRRVRSGAERVIFLVMLLSTTAWAWGIALFSEASSLDRAQLFVNLYYIAALMIGSSLLSYALDNFGVRNKFALSITFLPAFVWAVLIITGQANFVTVLDIVGSLTERVAINYGIYSTYALTFAATGGFAIALLYMVALKTTNIERKRRLLIAHGITVACLAGMLFNLVLPGLGNYDLIGIGPLFTAVFTLSVAYSIVNYSMFDLRQSFLLSFSYILTYGALLVIYAVLLWLVTVLSIDNASSHANQLVNVVLIIVTATTFQPIKKRFDRLTEKIFFRHDYDMQAVLRRTSQITSVTTELDVLLQRIIRLVNQYMQATFVGVVVVDKKGKVLADVNIGAKESFTKHDKEHLLHVINTSSATLTDALKRDSLQYRQLRPLGIALVAPFHGASDSSGYIAFGEKRSGVGYSSKDIETIELVVHELMLAVENCLRYEQIRAFNMTLEQRIDDATRELKQSNKKLKLMDQTKDEFISLTSHQLRTPLTTIKGYISMLLDGDAGELQPQQRKLLEEAFNSSQRMVHLISDFLNISRIQTGKFMIELAKVNLADVLDEEIEQLRVSALSRQITLAYDKPAAFPAIATDEGKIRQVMMNFIDNAIYYSPGGTTVRITLTHTAGAVEFRVIDQGIGVPKAEQHKLFNKFSRASNARKARPDGTGIGLFMAKKVIVALNGALIFQSEEGKGSTFGFRLNRTN